MALPVVALPDCQWHCQCQCASGTQCRTHWQAAQSQSLHWPGCSAAVPASHRPVTRMSVLTATGSAAWHCCRAASVASAASGHWAPLAYTGGTGRSGRPACRTHSGRSSSCLLRLLLSPWRVHAAQVNCGWWVEGRKAAVEGVLGGWLGSGTLPSRLPGVTLQSIHFVTKKGRWFFLF
jgi:hypothetical protein